MWKIIGCIIIWCVFINPQKKQSISSLYNDNNIECTLQCNQLHFQYGDTVKAKLNIKNISTSSIFIQKHKDNKSTIELTDEVLYDFVFGYQLLGELFFHSLMHYEIEIYLEKLTPGDQRDFTIVIPYNYYKDIQAFGESTNSLHVREDIIRLGIKMK